LGTICNHVSPLPSFFIIGPPRTGTTWLHNVLSPCASLLFDQHFDLGLAWYRSHFRKVADGEVIGEVAPTYFASPLARERIARIIPQAKIVCVFRNPVDRVVSLYRLKRAYGLIRWSFEEALKNDPELMETSRYAFHLQQWKQTFGNAQVMVTVHEDIEKRSTILPGPAGKLHWIAGAEVALDRAPARADLRRYDGASPLLLDPGSAADVGVGEKATLGLRGGHSKEGGSSEAVPRGRAHILGTFACAEGKLAGTVPP
jgi:Sulfotransferase domain